jgi:DNA-binding transcriptional MerR regulator
VEKKTYRIGQFAKKASVSVRTLRFYDQVGLLVPSYYSEAGYRLYCEADFPRLQQILGLKYLGFSLEEIQRCLRNGPTSFKGALAVQKAMLVERKAHLESIIQSIEETEAHIMGSSRSNNTPDWEPIIKIIEVIRMEEKNDWVKKYFNDEQLKKMKELRESSYSEEDRQKLAEWGKGWSEEDQRQADRTWGDLYADAKRLADAGQDPAGPEAQALVERWMNQVNAFTHGDPGITAGLQKFWEKMGSLPAEQAPMSKVLDDRQQAFVDQAMAIYNQRQTKA